MRILADMSTVHIGARRGTVRRTDGHSSPLPVYGVVLHRARMSNAAQRVRRAVKAARVARGWDQIELAAKAGVSRGTVQKLERGERLSEENEYRIEGALGWTPGSLDRIRAGLGPIQAQEQPLGKPLAELTRDEAVVRANEVAEATGDDTAGDRFIDEWAAARRERRRAGRRGTA